MHEINFQKLSSLSD